MKRVEKNFIDLCPQEHIYQTAPCHIPPDRELNTTTAWNILLWWPWHVIMWVATHVCLLPTRANCSESWNAPYQRRVLVVLVSQYWNHIFRLILIATFTSIPSNYVVCSIFTLCRTYSVQGLFTSNICFHPVTRPWQISQYDWMTRTLSNRNVITSPVQHNFLKVFESWAFRSGIQCLDHFEPGMWGHDVGICSSNDAASYRSRSEPSRKFGGTSLSLSVNKCGWSMKQTTHLPFIAVQRSTTSISFFIVGLLHLWKKTPPIALGELNPNVSAGRFETFRCSSC